MPISGEFYFVKIGSIYFTDTGLVGGRACLTKIDGLPMTFSTREGATKIPLSGSPFNFTREQSYKGVKLTLKPEVITNTVLENLRTAFDAADVANTPVAVEISEGPGATTTLKLDCKPFWADENSPPIKFSDQFFNDDVYDAEIRLVTDGLTAAP